MSHTDHVAAGLVSLQFHDGAGNAYAYAPETGTLRYEPVTPATSSSGTYSGGQPWEVSITVAEARAMRSVFEAAAGAIADHAPTRSKGTGDVRIGKGSSVARYLLRMDSRGLVAVQAAVARHAPSP